MSSIILVQKRTFYKIFLLLTLGLKNKQINEKTTHGHAYYSFSALTNDNPIYLVIIMHLFYNML